MNSLVLYNSIYELIHKIDELKNFCISEEIDTTKLAGVEYLLTGFLTDLEQTLSYKMERNEYYGDDLDEVGKEDLYSMIKEIGYDQVAATFDNVNEILAEEEY